MNDIDPNTCGYEPGHLYLLRYTGWVEGPFLVLSIERSTVRFDNYFVNILTAQGELMKLQTTFCVGGKVPYNFEEVS